MTWRYGAFELDSTIPLEGVDARTYLEAKYDAATVAAMHARLAEVMAAEGLPAATWPSRACGRTPSRRTG